MGTIFSHDKLATLKCCLIDKLLLCAVYLCGDYVQPRLAPCIRASTEINPPKTARGCPCRGAITMTTHAFLSPYRMPACQCTVGSGDFPVLGGLQQNWFCGHEKTMHICFIFVIVVAVFLFCFVLAFCYSGEVMLNVLRCQLIY